MNNDTLLGILFGSICGLGLIAAIATLILGAIYKTRFGINLGKAECSKCGRAAPAVRVPKTTYETLWGGWTCEKCGQQNDKWGR